jgi:hypothetical protein
MSQPKKINASIKNNGIGLDTSNLDETHANEVVKLFGTYNNSLADFCNIFARNTETTLKLRIKFNEREWNRIVNQTTFILNLDVYNPIIMIINLKNNSILRFANEEEVFLYANTINTIYNISSQSFVIIPENKSPLYYVLFRSSKIVY